MRRAICLVFSIFLSVAALAGIKVLDLPVLITILLVIPVTIFTLVSHAFLVGWKITGGQ